MKKIRIGVLGSANIAGRMVIPAIQECEFTELAAVASRRLDSAKALTDRFGGDAVEGYDALVQRADIDALYIPLPNGLHKEWVLKGIVNGKHILCEKSLGVNLAETKEMVAAAREAKVLLMENFMFTFHSQQKHIKGIIDSGELGEIRGIKSSFGFPPFGDASNIRYSKELGGGALLDAGAYPIKAIQHFFGYSCQVQGSHLNVDKDKGVDIDGAALVLVDGRIPAQLSWGFNNFYQCNLELWGSKGKLVAHRVFTAGPGVRPSITIEKHNEKSDFVLHPDNHFVNILSDFCRAISSGSYEANYLELLSQSQLIDDVRSQSKNH